MLASDREREAAILRLKAAHVEGRLDTDELEERIGRAQAARTRDELAAVAADLPAKAIEVEPTSGVPRIPGRRHFVVRRVVDGTPDEVRRSITTRILPPLAVKGFYLHSETDDKLRVENLWRVGSRFTVTLTDAGDHRTLVVVNGRAPLSVRREFAAL